MTLRWQAIPDPAAQALLRELRRWDGTPFVAGAQAPGDGADCVGFAGGVLDALRGTKTPIRTLPHGAALHDPDGAAEDLFRLLSAFQPLETVRGPVVEPGDLIVTTAGRTGGPGHLFMAGTQARTVWGALPRHGVRKWGLVVLSGVQVIRVYRPTDKGSWA